MRRASTAALTAAIAMLLLATYSSSALAADRDSVGTKDLPDTSALGVQLTCIDVQTELPFDYRAQRVLLTGSIDRDWHPDSTRLCLGSLAGLRQRLISDGTGGGYAGWADGRLGEPDIYAQHFTSDGAVADGWPLGGLRICATRYSQYHLDMTGDGAGGAYIVWEDYRGGAGDIYLQRIMVTGEPASGWPTDGLPVCTADGEQSLPRLALDAAGGAYIVWQDRRSGVLQVYLQHVENSGAIAPGWPANGEALSGSTPVAEAPIVFSDSSGAGAVIWRHERDDGTWDLLAVPLPAEATTISPTPNVLVSGAEELGEVGNVLAGAHGGFVGWRERRSGASTIRVQSIDLSSGFSTGWASGGVIASAGTVGGNAPSLLPDGSGGAVIAWEDHRGGEGDIYAQRLSSSGTRVSNWPDSGLAICTASGDQYAPVLTRDSTQAVFATWSDAALGTSGRYLRSIPFLWGSPPRLVSAVAKPGHVRIVWQMAGPEKPSFTAYRQLGNDQGGQWDQLQVVTPADSGKIVLEDRTIPEGGHVEYRLGLATEDATYSFEVVALDVPRAPTVLTLHFARTLGREHTILVSFALPRGAPPLLDLIDVSGRRVTSQRLNGLEPGEQVARFALPAQTPSGVYFLRLVQGGQSRVAKVILIR